MKGMALAALAGWGSVRAVPSSCCSACLMPDVGRSNRSALLSCEDVGDQMCLAFALSVCGEFRVLQKKKKTPKLGHCHIFAFMMPFYLDLFVVLLSL